MFFGKALFTTFAFAAMAISNVASAPTAATNADLVHKRTSTSSASYVMNQYYIQVQNKCNDIGSTISKHGDVIDVTVAVKIEADLKVIVDLIVKLCAEIKIEIAAGVSYKDIHTCGSTFILLVNLLVAILVKILGACQKDAIVILAAVVVSLKVQIQICASLIIGSIEGILGGIVGILVDIVLKLLASLKVDINACIEVFVGTCGKYSY